MSYARVRDLLAAGHNVFLTGSAGTGKSYILNQLQEDLPDMVVTASTGAAAINVSGTTIHSFAGIGIGDLPAESLMYRMRAETRDRIMQCSLLAIDEISMIGAEALDLINEVMKRVRGSERPFGGIQVIVVGDFLQLPPVTRDGEECRFAFESDVWEEAAFKTVLLTHVYRQKDEEFLKTLARVRSGEEVHFSDIGPAMPTSQYIDQGFNNAVRLFALNRLADAYNLDRLREIKGPQVWYEAADFGSNRNIETINKHCLAPKDLYLKVGARVMLLLNKDIEGGLINGSMGTVARLNPGEAIVQFDNGRTMTLIKEKVGRIRDHHEDVAWREQIPLRLAWAISIHKSQGLTLDRIHIDASGVFEAGQMYVALSRARTKEGISLVNYNPKDIRAHVKAVEFYRGLQ